MASSSSNVVGVHYRVGKKIGEGSFGVIFEGTNLLNNQQVAIKFVRHVLHIHAPCRGEGRPTPPRPAPDRQMEGRRQANMADAYRNLERATPRNSETSIVPTKSWLAAVSPPGAMCARCRH